MTHSLTDSSAGQSAEVLGLRRSTQTPGQTRS